MEVKELSKIRETISKELEIAEKELKRVEKLHEEVTKEVNTRKRLLYAVTDLIELKEE